MTKVVNTYSTPETKGMGLDWELTKKKVDTTTGADISGDGDKARSDRAAPEQTAGTALKEMFDKTRVKDADVPKTAREVVERGKLPDADRPKGEMAQRQQVKYQEMRGEARELTRMAQGTVKPSEGQEKMSDGTLLPRQSPQVQQQVASQTQRPQVQTAATVFAGIGKPLAEPPLAKPVPTPKEQKGPQEKGPVPQHGEQQATTQAGHAAATAAGQGVQKTTQQIEISADTDTGGAKEEQEEEEQDAGATGAPHSQKELIKRSLMRLSSGLGGSAGDEEDKAGFEKLADAVEPLDVERSGTGCEIYNATAEEERVEQAARQYGKVEQLLRPLVPIDDKVERYSEKGLIDRFIIDTKEQVDAAQLLLQQLRDTRRGRGTAGGYGMSA